MLLRRIPDYKYENTPKPFSNHRGLYIRVEVWGFRRLGSQGFRVRLTRDAKTCYEGSHHCGPSGIGFGTLRSLRALSSTLEVCIVPVGPGRGVVADILKGLTSENPTKSLKLLALSKNRTLKSYTGPCTLDALSIILGTRTAQNGLKPTLGLGGTLGFCGPARNRIAPL